MYTEYFLNTVEDSENDIKSYMEKIEKYQIKNILTLYNNLRFLKKNFPIHNYGSFIDYPIASCDLSRRQDLISDAIDGGANFICITVPSTYIVNKKYNKFREDIEKNKNLCLGKSVELRYILEYRKFDHQLMAKVCNILVSMDIKVVYPATGFFLDNIDDNIIASNFLKSKTNIDMIINANIWTKKQLENLLNNKPYGISISQINTLDIISNNTLYEEK